MNEAPAADGLSVRPYRGRNGRAAFSSGAKSSEPSVLRRLRRIVAAWLVCALARSLRLLAGARRLAGILDKVLGYIAVTLTIHLSISVFAEMTWRAERGGEGATTPSFWHFLVGEVQ